MPGKILNVGIAGMGRSGFDIHARWLRTAQGQYRIAAVADETPVRRAEAAKELHCRVYSHYSQLLEDKSLDLFVNALPSFLHPKVTIAALKAGHHVVCEKPLATKVRDVDRMTTAAKNAGRVLAPFQNSRFYPFFTKIQELIASDKLGRVLHVRSNWSGFSRRWDWQTLQKMWGGNLNNTGPHPLDHAIMLFGNKKPDVFCRLHSDSGSYGDADDFSLVVLYGRGSPTVEVLISSYQAYAQGDMYSISCANGGLTGGPDGLKWRYFDPAKPPKHRLQRGWAQGRKFCSESLRWTEESWRPPKTKLDAFQQNSKAFYDNVHDVLTGNGKLVVTPAQVRRQIAVVEECHRQNLLPKLPK